MMLRSLLTTTAKWPANIRFLCTLNEIKSELFDRELYLENRAARIVLNAPKIRNSLSFELMESLLKELKEMDRIEKLRAVIIAGNGPAFSAGHDLKELTTATGADYHKKVFAKCTEMMSFIQQMQLPVIAEVDGIAAAAGCQLVASCDIVVASPKSKFMVPGQKVGLFCSTPGIPLVRTMNRKVAMDMLLTARALSAQEAMQAGLVSRISKEGEEPRFEALKAAEEICQFSRSVTALGKLFFYTQVELSQRDAYRFKMIHIVVELKDHEENSHEKEKVVFEDKVTIDHLQIILSERFKIQVADQRIFHNKKRLDLSFGTVEKAGVVDEDTIVLKHCGLERWKAVITSMDAANKCILQKNQGMAKENIEFAFKDLTFLKQSNFFHCYPRFRSGLLEFNDKLSQYLDTTKDLMEAAARAYFRLLFRDNAKNPSITVKLTDKEKTGVQGGYICAVMQSEKCLGRYFLKTHCGVQKLVSSNKPVDLRELFVYKVLENLKIGPTVHFIPNEHASSFGYYIATEEVQGFKPADKVIMPQIEVYKFDLVKAIFLLTDLTGNKDNYGINMDCKLCIVDFLVRENKSTVRTSLNSLMNSSERRECFNECIDNWNLEDTVNSTEKEILKEKVSLKNASVKYGSDGYGDYVKKVLDNINYVKNYLERKRKGGTAETGSPSKAKKPS